MSSTSHGIPEGCTGELDAGVLVHNDKTCPQHERLPHQIATFAANLARQHGLPVGELLQAALHRSGDYEPDSKQQLSVYVVRSENGERRWQAESTEHAREQHDEAFGEEPGETVLGVRKARG
jgi:hypothetical protein